MTTTLTVERIARELQKADTALWCAYDETDVMIAIGDGDNPEARYLLLHLDMARKAVKHCRDTIALYKEKHP